MARSLVIVESPSLVIVESPAKAKTINKYLGRNFTVKASIGHVMDLPKKTIGIRLPGEDPSGRRKRKKKKGAKKGARTEEKNTKKPITLDDDKIFEPTLQIIAGKGKVINDLRKAAHSAEAVYLAGDPDREGEAISAHLALVLSKPAKFIEQEPSVSRFKKKEATPEEPPKKEDASDPKKEPVAIDPKKIFRVTFNEITPKAIRAAFDKPRQVDTNLVDAQQARRVLDRIVGYKVSPILWDKVRRGLSAGRVQTVALRLIVEREQQIRAFIPQEYWTIHAMLDAGQPPLFEAKLFKYKGEDIAVSNQEAAEQIVREVGKAKWQVATVTQKEKKRNPPPPFTTSKLQQAAYNRLRYTAKRTMSLAQKLYEGVELGEEGSVALITYMRTDSVHVSNDALAQVRELIPERFGSNYLPEKPNYYKSKKDAQEAHEAVRPTDAMRAPEDVRKYLDEDLFKLYQLIWQRFVASQMLPAIFDQTTIDIAAGDYTFRATGSVQKFDGYLRVYQMPASIADREDDEKDDEGEGRALPQVAEGQTVSRPRCSASASVCCWSRASKTFSMSPLPRGSKRNSMKLKKANCPGARPSESSGKNSSLTSTRLTTRCFLTRPAFPRGKNAKSAARANCWSASAATASSLAVRAIPNAISFKTCPPRLRRRPAANPKPSIATIAGRRWPSSAGASALFSLAPVTRTAEPRGA